MRTEQLRRTELSPGCAFLSCILFRFYILCLWMTLVLLLCDRNRSHSLGVHTPAWGQRVDSCSFTIGTRSKSWASFAGHRNHPRAIHNLWLINLLFNKPCNLISCLVHIVFSLILGNNYIEHPGLIRANAAEFGSLKIGSRWSFLQFFIRANHSQLYIMFC